VDDKELLLIYYIKSGGASDFAERYDRAMGVVNRWYCSEFYGRDVRDPVILWDYYMRHAGSRASGKHVRNVEQREMMIAS